MSKLAGLYHPGCRTVTQEERWRAGSALGSAFQGMVDYSAPGIWMLQAPDFRETGNARHDFPATGFSGRLRSAGELSSGRGSANACSFDGRIDNRKDLLDQFGGSAVRQSTDSALLLTVYEAGGIDGLDRIIGDWSTAIWDAAHQTLMLASDYAGVRPLYYHSRPDGTVLWASSLSTLVRWTGSPELDEQYMAEFLTTGHSGRTPYHGIHAVPPGHAVCFSDLRHEQHSYWRAPLGKTIRYERQETYEEHLRELFHDAVTCRLTENRVAAELSGGLDSSSVVSMAARAAAAKAGSEIVTFSYRAEGLKDEKFFTLVERASNTTPVHLDSTGFPFLTPAATGESAPSFWQPRWEETARTMRSMGLRTLLTGQWGDYVMGNCMDDSEQAADYLRRGRIAAGFEEALSWSQALRLPVYSLFWRAIRAALPWRPPLTGDLEATVAEGRTYGDSLTSSFRKKVAGSEALWRLPRGGGLCPTSRKRWSGLYGLINARGLQCPEAMQSLACTHPFTHRPLVEYMLSIPASVVCRPGEPRRLMRSAFAGLLPEPVLKRRSKSTYQGIFLKSLEPLARNLIRGEVPMLLAERGCVDPVHLRSRLQLLLQGMDCNEPQLRHILLLEFWLRRRQQAPAEDSNPSIPQVAEQAFHAAAAG